MKSDKENVYEAQGKFWLGEESDENFQGKMIVRKKKIKTRSSIS